MNCFQRFYSLTILIAVASSIVSQEQLVDRQTIWIQAFDSQASNSLKAKASGENPISPSQPIQNKEMNGELLGKLNSSTKRWSDAEATWVYQQLCRAWLTRNSTIPQARFVDMTVESRLKLEVQARALQRHPIVGWPAGSYSLTMTPHFAIASQGSTKHANEIARLCEQTYAIWRQLFFASWCKAETLQHAINSQTILPEPNLPRFQVNLFRNREAYVKQLQQFEPNIAVSTGYYSPKLNAVFCYWDETTSVATLRHELVHQFFSQATGQETQLPEEFRTDFWIVEGLALYMESIEIANAEGFDLATVGGWDAARLQPARYRRLHDEMWIPWEEFRRANSQRFRTGEEIKAWYSQAAGLTHFWMDRGPEHRQALLDYAMRAYRGTTRADDSIEGQPDEVLRRAYDSFLLLTASKVSEVPPSTNSKEIVLSRCPVTSNELLRWPETKRTLDWFDLSFSKIDDQLFLHPSDLPSRKTWDVRRLNVESTGVTDASVPIIGKMQRLEELDLSSCGITDQGLEGLRGHKTLKSLWLTGNTGITDRGLAILASLPKLELVDLSATSITEEGWKTLLSKSPRLKRKANSR